MLIIMQQVGPRFFAPRRVIENKICEYVEPIVITKITNDEREHK